MGPRQESWFYRKLSDSAKRGATWRVVGDQIRFTRLERTAPDGRVDFNVDDWAVCGFFHIARGIGIYLN